MSVVSTALPPGPASTRRAPIPLPAFWTWSLESLATQTLVIFVIRTADRPWASRPSPALAWGVTACAAAGAVLPFTPAAPWLGFTPLPPLFFAFLLAMIASYLAVVEVVKRWFYRRYSP